MREADRKRERRGIDSENDQHLRFNFYLIRFFLFQPNKFLAYTQIYVFRNYAIIYTRFTGFVCVRESARAQNGNKTQMICEKNISRTVPN